METGDQLTRNGLFQELKPVCVELSQFAIRDDGSSESTKSLTQSVGRVLALLESKCKRKDGVFDGRLADYVFFPLSQILQRRKKYTDQLSELVIKCVQILLEYGWKATIALDLARQLLVLLTFVAGGTPGKEVVPVPEEMMIIAYRALTSLFHDLALIADGAASLIEPDTIPLLGHCITVILEGITDGPTPKVQLTALIALKSVWQCIKAPAVLSSFLPGTVSALTKCLMPSTNSRRTAKVIVTALEVLNCVIVSLLSDIRTRSIRNSKPTASQGDSKSVGDVVLTASWLKATAAQIKLVLSTIVRLKSHQSDEVKSALDRLCLMVLDECHETLSESASILVETCLALGTSREENIHTDRHTTLVDLASIYPDIGELVQGTVYDWAIGLPRVMQSNNDTAKRAALGQLSKAHKLLSDLGLGSSTLEDAFCSALRDSITVTLAPASVVGKLQEAELNIDSQAVMALTTDQAHSLAFKPFILPEESQRQVREQFMILLDNTGTRDLQLKMASELLEYAHGASGSSLLSAYWLASQILQSSTSKNEDLDQYFESSLTMSNEQVPVDQELFSFSLSILTESEETVDWRLQATALEVVARTAQRLQQEFRSELVDALYPLTRLLASSDSRLREHAITCLNIVSQSCGYKNASDLIVSNVDYMVNAISLRLNTFNISPEAPQVLVMMIRLTGPSLLLYLDDVVESIFAALDNFHGYERLVEALFSVLGEIVSIGSKSDQLQIASAPPIPKHKSGPTPEPIEDIVKLLTPKPVGQPEPHTDFPHEPWKSASTLLDEAQAKQQEPSETDEPEDPPPSELQPAPPTKPYTMLTSITRLSQHYLTSTSPHLRIKLLKLITTSSLALCSSEEAFLPLINDIWPVLIKRIYDSEVYVQIAAMETISTLCESAGDFLSTRIQDEWGSLMRAAKQARAGKEKELKGNEGRNAYSHASKVWDGFVGLFTAVVMFVRISDEALDDVLDLLGASLDGRVREALEGGNSDLVWLSMQMQGGNEEIEVPRLDGFQFATLYSGVRA